MAVVLYSWWADLVGLGCGLLLLLYLYFRHSYSYWKKRGVSYMEPSFPFGNTIDHVFLSATLGEVFSRPYTQFPNEKYVGMYITLRPALVLRDMESIRRFLVKDFLHFNDRDFNINFNVDSLLANLFFLRGHRWKYLRAKLTPTFTSGKMKMMFQILLECADELRTHLDEPALKGEVVEVKDVLARFTTDVISSCAFGIQCNCLKDPDAEFRQYSVKFLRPSAKSIIGGILNFVLPSVNAVLQIPCTDRDVNDFFFKIVRETIEFREKNGIERNDFMQLLIRLKNTGFVDQEEAAEAGDDVQKLTMQEVTANAFIFFLAGFETSSTTMSFCVYELACNPSIQDRLREEIDSTLKKHGGLTYEAIHNMLYLDMVIAETLRKYPPFPILNRECTKRYQLPDSDAFIDPGVSVIVPVLAIHRDPQYYPDPEVFDPERFTEEAKARRPHFSYLPFGEGPRNCIGIRFGLMQTKVGIISLLSRFQFNVCERTAIPLVMDPKSFIMSPPGGIFLKVSRRTETFPRDD